MAACYVKGNALKLEYVGRQAERLRKLILGKMPQDSTLCISVHLNTDM